VLRLSIILLITLGRPHQARAAVERTVEKTFIVAAGVTLKLDTCHGAIRIEPSTDNHLQVLVRETMNVPTEDDADRLQHHLNLTFEQTPAQVSIKARFKRSVRWAWESWPPVALAYAIKLPRDSHLKLTTAEGDITVCSLKGNVQARAGNGAIFTGDINGSVSATSTRGDLSVTACTGPLTLSAQQGNVLVGRAHGITKINAADGTIEVQNARGPLFIKADAADIKVGFPHPLLAPAELRADGGDIEALFDPRCAANLDAHASTFGEVKVKNLALKIESGKPGTSRVRGTLNGGGPKLLLKASGGNIRLTGLEP